MSKQKIKKHFPVIVSSLSLIATFYIAIKSLINIVFLFIAHTTGGLNKILLFGDPLTPSLWSFLLTTPFIIWLWLVSTRVKFYQSLFWRMIQFATMLISILCSLIWIITADSYNNLIPYFEERANMIEGGSALQEVLLGNTHQFLLLVMTLPIIAIVLLLLYLGGLFTKNQKETLEAFKAYEFKSKLVQKFTKPERETGLPDVIIGPDSETGEIVTIPGGDRSLNTVIIGSIGTGKTAAQGTPLINQDLHHYVKYINDYPVISKREDYHKIKGNYLNGLVVIEPSNDLCKDVYELCKAHAIPDEMIYYVDPSNPDTPSINPLQGPVDKVAESIAMVIEGLGENNNFFFQQSQRAHLKQYIYLLKLYTDEEPTLAELYQMYNDVQLVHKMHMQLKERINKFAPLAKTETEKDFWDVVKDTDRWFDANIIPVLDRNGQPVTIREGQYRKEVEYYDKKAEFIEGLKNILADISSNLLLRRVLFKRSTFDMDAHLKAGGILLINTEKGSLMELSKVLGKMVLLSVQNAVFRREPRIDPYHSIYVDEFPEYIYKPFGNFPAQSRKYKANIHVIAQTIAQLADDYGVYFMHTLLTTFRNKMVFADVSEYDAKTFSFLFHEKNSYKESTTEQSVSPLQESPVSREGSSYAQQKEAVLTPGDILSLKAFEVAAKIVVNNESKPARRVKANFVPQNEFKEAIVTIDPEAAKIWLNDRKAIVEASRQGNIVETDIKIETVDQQEKRLEEEAQEIDQQVLESSLQAKHRNQPDPIIQFEAIPNAYINQSTSIDEEVIEMGAYTKSNPVDLVTNENEEQDQPPVKESTLNKPSIEEEKHIEIKEGIEVQENSIEDSPLVNGLDFIPNRKQEGIDQYTKQKSQSNQLIKEKPNEVPSAEESQLTNKQINFYESLYQNLNTDDDE